MIKFYKKALILCLSSFIGLMSMQAQMPKFTMTTAKAVGQNLEFTLNYGPTITVDWGDGKTVEYPSVGKPITGELKGNTVTVSGFDISMIDCSNQQLTALSVDELSNLQTLLCAKNQLTELSITTNGQLLKVNCSYNNLTALQLSSTLSNLEELNISHNQIASTPMFIQTKALKVLICNNNELSALSLSLNTSLKTLWCYSNNISTLNASKLTALENLLCYDNEIKTLNVTGLTSLKSIWCDHNNLSSLNLSTNTALNYLSTDYNNLSSITTPTTFNIKNLYVENNALGFGGLHSGAGITNYGYHGQYLIILPTTSYIELNKELDLSNQLTTIDGVNTEAQFTWYGDGNKLTAGTDYTEDAGKFTFLKSFDKAYCEITSSLFPNINKVTTNVIGVASTAGVDENQVQQLKAFVQDGRLIVKVPTEQSLKIYNLMGRLVKSLESVVGTVEIDLPRGTYIVNNKKVIL